MKNGNVMGFCGYRFFSPKSSNAKYSMLGTSEANFGGKINAYNTQGSTVDALGLSPALVLLTTNFYYHHHSQPKIT